MELTEKATELFKEGKFVEALSAYKYALNAVLLNKLFAGSEDHETTSDL